MKIYSLLLFLVTAGNLHAQNRSEAAPQLAPGAAVKNAGSPTTNDPVDVLIGTWRFTYSTGWVGTRTFSKNGTFVGQGFGGIAKWEIVGKKVVLHYTTADKTVEEMPLPLDPAGTKVSHKSTTAKDGTVNAVKESTTASIAKNVPPVETPDLSKPATTPAPVLVPGSSATTAELVKTYRNSLVFVTGSNGSGSGFLANYGAGTVLFTNAHVAAGVKSAAFKTLDGTQVKIGAASCAVGHDVFFLQATTSGKPLEIMKGVDENAAIGDEVVVLGNAEGAGVINTITGKIVGLGPQLVEVDAAFQPGNSGSPIIHLKSGKVIGVATYAVIRKYDPSTKEPVKEPVIRRFGYRLDSIKTWQPVNWPAFSAQAAEMEAIEKLTSDLGNFLDALARNSHVTRGASSNPVIKNRIDSWLEDRAKRLSPRDAAMADQSFLSFLKITCQNDVAAARQHLSYDYFQRGLADQQRERDEISGVFNEIIQNIPQGK